MTNLQYLRMKSSTILNKYEDFSGFTRILRIYNELTMRIDTYNKFVIGMNLSSEDKNATGELQLPVKWIYNVYE